MSGVVFYGRYGADTTTPRDAAKTQQAAPHWTKSGGAVAALRRLERQP